MSFTMGQTCKIFQSVISNCLNSSRCFTELLSNWLLRWIEVIGNYFLLLVQTHPLLLVHSCNLSLIRFWGHNFIQWLEPLLWLVQYEIHNGFWDRSKIRLRAEDETNTLRIKTEMGLLTTELESKLVQIESINQQLSDSQKLLSRFYSEKQIEYKSFSNNQVVAIQALDSIRWAELDAAKANCQMTAHVQQVSDDAVNQKSIEKDRNQFAELAKTSNELQTQFDNSIAGLDGVRKIRCYVEQRQGERTAHT